MGARPRRGEGRKSRRSRWRRLWCGAAKDCQRRRGIACNFKPPKRYHLGGITNVKVLNNFESEFCGAVNGSWGKKMGKPWKMELLYKFAASFDSEFGFLRSQHSFLPETVVPAVGAEQDPEGLRGRVLVKGDRLVLCAERVRGGLPRAMNIKQKSII